MPDAGYCQGDDKSGTEAPEGGKIAPCLLPLLQIQKKAEGK